MENNGIQIQSDQTDFIEIVNPQRLHSIPQSNFVLALAVSIEPKDCATLVRRLSTELPLISNNAGLDLSHLKRVKRTQASVRAQRNEESHINAFNQQIHPEEATSKKRKLSADQPVVLNVLLGAISVLAERFGLLSSDETNVDLSHLENHVPLKNVHVVQVPSRLAESEEEWKELNAMWPLVYLPNKTKEFLETERKLTNAEITMMRQGMDAAIDDARLFREDYGASLSSVCDSFHGVVVVCPQSGHVVATANGERQLQTPPSVNQCPHVNPLSTPYLLAVQAVSRSERHVVNTSVNGTHSESFQNGQYLCTGYDVYGTLEPTVYEAMALVHSRIRTLVFGCSRHDIELPTGGIVDAHVHALPGTNHRYRSFVCNKSSEVWKRCNCTSASASNETV